VRRRGTPRSGDWMKHVSNRDGGGVPGASSRMAPGPAEREPREVGRMKVSTLVAAGALALFLFGSSSWAAQAGTPDKKPVAAKQSAAKPAQKAPLAKPKPKPKPKAGASKPSDGSDRGSAARQAILKDKGKSKGGAPAKPGLLPKNKAGKPPVRPATK